MTATTATTNTHSSLDGLPKPFVNAMRTLFDIMDDQCTGYVKFSEIERRWQDDGAQGMPRGVLASLRKVTPPDGYLSFDRFCAGLQISLLRNKIEDRPCKAEEQMCRSASAAPAKHYPAPGPLPAAPPLPRSRPPSAPLLDQEPQQVRLGRGSSSSSGVRVRHRPAERAASMPHLDPPMHPHDLNAVSHHYDHMQAHPPIDKNLQNKACTNLPGPPKPPRVMVERERGTHSLDRNLDRCERDYKTTDYRGTRSLDREGGQRQWDREQQQQQQQQQGERPRTDRGEVEVRHERSNSLEKLLHPEDTRHSSYPLRRAGIRSALQTWHKERSKSDLTDNDTNNNCTNNNFSQHNKLTAKHYITEPRLVMGEPAGRGVGDGGNNHKGSGASEASHTAIHPASAAHALTHASTATYSTSASHLSTHSAAVTHAATHSLPAPHPAIPTSQAAAVPQAGQVEGAAAVTHKKSSRKKESRRHTLQNGIDNNMIRRLKQLEAERDMLVQGYEVVEQARSWYRHQLQAISDRIQNVPQGSHKQEPSMEAQQERLDFQLARIHEVNANLQALMEATEHGLPSHLALHSSASRSRHRDDPQQRVVNHLKTQNHLLTEEVSSKSERITGLEREKAALLRELLQSRPSSLHSVPPLTQDSTFM